MQGTALWPLYYVGPCIYRLLAFVRSCWCSFGKLFFCYTRFTPCSSAGSSSPQTPLRYSLCSLVLVGENSRPRCSARLLTHSPQVFCPRKRFFLAKLGKPTRILIFYTPRQKSLRRPGRRLLHSLSPEPDFHATAWLFPGRACSCSQSARLKIKKISKLSFQSTISH